MLLLYTLSLHLLSFRGRGAVVVGDDLLQGPGEDRVSEGLEEEEGGEGEKMERGCMDEG